ncbi:uncharacterized protein STEHIDRAFT_164684 [Stereum hirsutum FP-91666 SS1]|uniref:uncharacterized protein n=1 Tax=Stereum hirsutum (strain FP-91666) TaxID=721885 RepID=UPI000440EEDC|nr:uncharacterized protein STEHIDRAFT_164684 [Stereum hirsutum FP-91666 SS1]EIM92397.1 hypothetical protein STEHIDRAFT_164684 [Stereum hirsutum FP-91666 SS1]
MHLQSLPFSLFLYLCSVAAHGAHEESKEPLTGDAAQYAQRHMATEHHIDSFDLASFFQLHDLNRDGVWDKEEVEAIYGVHHVYSQKKSKDDEEHKAKAKVIVDTIMNALDKNKDEVVTMEEFESVGLAALPNFDNMGAEGHHYDVESEFFLHHEEEYHSTPETQTDEAYNHPEDIEHFASHEKIEIQEAEREAKFQGISVEEALAQHEPPPEDPNAPAPESITNDSANVVAEGGDVAQEPVAAASKKIQVQREPSPDEVDPAIRFREAKAESEKHGEWGSGDSGYKFPSSPSEKMRKNLPYKYKFRRSWGDF